LGSIPNGFAINEVPVIPAFTQLDAVHRLKRLRQTSLLGYSAALAAVAIATALRFALAGYVMHGVPFITYFPAIAIATLIGGFWPGVLAAVISGFLAWVLFISRVHVQFPKG
jgi:K+-sensing histidine kinase KdpD